MNVLDREFATAEAAVFREDLKATNRVTLREWTNRPWREKLVERFAGLFRSQL